MGNSAPCMALYVDNKVITHVDPNIVTYVINNVEEKFGKMTVTTVGVSHINS